MESMVDSFLNSGSYYLYGVMGIIFALIWIYSFISILVNDFKSGATKVVWLIAILIFPITCIIYPFARNKQVLR